VKKNFVVKDAVLFGFSGEMIDLRGDCELASVNFYPGKSPSVEVKWDIQRSNHQVHMIFSSVEDFIVRSRDVAYPAESGAMLAIAGFSDGVSCGSDDQFYVEPTQEMNYMSFVMDDRSVILIKAGSAIIRRA
jgi:hypothetical protein